MIKYVIVGAFKYKIIESDKMSDNGTIDCEKLNIFIESSMNKQVKRQTLWHELMHAIMYEFGLPQSEHDEKLIDNIAHGVMQILRDNPELRKLP